MAAAGACTTGSRAAGGPPVRLEPAHHPTCSRTDLFATLSDRLADTFKNLRGKGRLSEADIDATAREIRIALLEADVALPVVKEFVAAVKERARGEEVSQALNPAQQVVKIVNEELVTILGGETRRLRYAKTGPTVIMLAGLQGAGKTTLAAKLALWLKEQGKSPLLVAADLQRPNAVNQLQVNGERAGVPVFAPEPGNGVGDPVEVARASIEEARRHLHDVVIVDTAGRLGVDAELMQQAADIRDAVQPDEILFVVDAMIGQDAVTTAQAFLDGRRVRRRRPHQARRRRPRWCRPVDRGVTGQAGHVRVGRREAHRLRRLPPRPDGLADPRHGRHADPDRAGREDLRPGAGAQGRRQADRPGRRVHPRRLPRADAAGPQARLDVQDHGDAARDGAVPRPARELRRARDRPDPGDHPVDDARPSGPTPRSSTAPAGPGSPRAPGARSPTSTASSTGSSRPAR